MPVVALNEDVSDGGSCSGRSASSCARCAGGLEQVRAAAGKHAAAPLVLAPRFMVTGAKPREHERTSRLETGRLGCGARLSVRPRRKQDVRGGGG
ncbi:hypothetical protein DIPPA_18846 [Diplonema papillatum]|nr:hypothetical protein DIPPA_18846 [Diplonema papillatum]